MPTAAPDDLYWNPMEMELDSDESLPYPNPNQNQKQHPYIDPWDLENYAYIRKHLDSVDLSSDPSSLGEPQETSGFYYIPAKPLAAKNEMFEHQQQAIEPTNAMTMELEKIYDSQPASHQDAEAEYYYTMQKAPTLQVRNERFGFGYETSTMSKMSTKASSMSMSRTNRTRRESRGGTEKSYADIDELLIRNNNDVANTRRKRHQTSRDLREAREAREASIYGGSLQYQHRQLYDQYDYEAAANEMDLYGIPENSTMQIYEKNKTLRRYQSNSKTNGPVAKMAKLRSHSFSVGDYEYDPYRLQPQQHQQPIYNGNDDIYAMRSDIYDSTGSHTQSSPTMMSMSMSQMSPIYDDIRSSLYQRTKPKHFKLSNYGHLKIDYSYSWNNLHKYIYN